MYTQCPECKTIFKLKETQLQARDGLVSCGNCAAIFRADQQLLDTLPEKGDKPGAKSHTGAATRSKSRRRRKHKRKTSSSAAKRRGHKPAETGKTLPFKIADPAIPTITELSLFSKPKPRTRPAFWIVGNLLLLALLAGQYAFFYRSELAQDARLKPLVLRFCNIIGCKIRAKQNIAQIELTWTKIAPHPKYENALRIRTSMVNRAGYRQPYPLMEVSLTDSAGKLLSRRTFKPREYLKQAGVVQGRAGYGVEDAKAVKTGMLPNVAVNTLLEVTNPDRKAVGFEIQLLSPQPES